MREKGLEVERGLRLIHGVVYEKKKGGEMKIELAGLIL